MANKVTAAHSPMARSPDSVASDVRSDSVEPAEDSVVATEPEVMAVATAVIVVVHHVVTDKFPKATTPPASRKVNADHAATEVTVHSAHVAADSVAVVASEEAHHAVLADHVVPAHPAAVIILTLKTKNTQNSPENEKLRNSKL